MSFSYSSYNMHMSSHTDHRIVIIVVHIHLRPAISRQGHVLHFTPTPASMKNPNIDKCQMVVGFPAGPQAKVRCMLGSPSVETLLLLHRRHHSDAFCFFIKHQAGHMSTEDLQSCSAEDRTVPVDVLL